MKDLVNEKMNEFVLFGHHYLLKFITNGLKHFQRLRSWRTDKPPGWRTEEWTKKLLVARNQLVNKWHHTVSGTRCPAFSNQVKKWNESGAAALCVLQNIGLSLSSQFQGHCPKRRERIEEKVILYSSGHELGERKRKQREMENTHFALNNENWRAKRDDQRHQSSIKKK